MNENNKNKTTINQSIKRNSYNNPSPTHRFASRYEQFYSYKVTFFHFTNISITKKKKEEENIIVCLFAITIQCAIDQMIK